MCSAAFFKNDGTGKLSRDNLPGYSIVDGEQVELNKIKVLSPGDTTPARRGSSNVKPLQTW